MGLDMYLTKETYVKNWDHMDSSQRTTVTVERGGEPYPGIDTSRIREIVEEVGYWRKANAIHAWFIQNCADGVDDCKPVYVPKEELGKLRTDCLRVLHDHSLAEGLLPSQGGFFFGSTEYDEWYFKDLEETVDILTRVLDELEATEGKHAYCDIYYRASW